jgi:dienelactone hydrolase
MRLLSILLLLSTLVLGHSAFSTNEQDNDTVENNVPATGPRSGEFQASFTVTELLGATSAQYYESIIPTDELIEWEIYVPESYKHERPAGVLVYISPSQKGSIPERWKSLMDAHNLIWIGANRSGNRVPVPRRVVYALTALAAIDKNYNVDVERVYLTGFSGGGKAASVASAQYPQIFKGAIFNCGARFWGSETPERLEQIMTNRYVFITGTYDHNLELTKKVFRAYERAGVENSKLMVIRNMTHSNPKSKHLEKAIAFLDLRGSDEQEITDETDSRKEISE